MNSRHVVEKNKTTPEELARAVTGESPPSAYDSFMGRWSKVVAREFLAWLAIPSGRRWLDVGCGTGILSAMILESASPGETQGVDPSEPSVAYAQSAIPDRRARFLVGDALALPHERENFDVVVSGLVLNQLPRPAEGIAEMIRVAKPGGVVAAYVWDFAEGMQMLRYFWDAAIELDPAAEALDQKSRFPLCHPERLRELFAGAGLADVQVRAIDAPAIFRDFDDYWTPFLGGRELRAPGYVISLDEEQRARLRERLRMRLPIRADGAIHLLARAWAVRGSPDGSQT
jgi:SAM-dependent methyltransferase